MGMTGHWTCIIVAGIALCACGGGGGGGEDTATDTTADTTVDTTADTPEDTESEDVAGEEAPPSCTGTDTLTLEFLDQGDGPVEDVVVALRCRDEQVEATSGADGRVTFEDLNLADNTVDFTFVFDGSATSMLGAGGDRPLPEVMTFWLGSLIPADMHEVSGDVVHSVTDSIVILLMDYWFNVQTSDRYIVQSTTGGTDLPMSVFEYTVDTEGAATVLGYSYSTYDTPDTGIDGPAAAASSSATIHTATLELSYDIRTGSPLEIVQPPTDEWTYSSRVTNGARIFGTRGTGATHREWIAGLTTSWTEGDPSDTLGFAWAEEGLTPAEQVAANVLVMDRSYRCYSMTVLPSEPTTWTTATIRDVPELPGFSTSAASPWDSEIEVVPPDWGTDHLLVYYHLRPSGAAPIFGSPPALWTVVPNPEVASFRFSELPWPSSIPMATIIPSMGSLYVGAGVQGFDADPFEGYVGWTDLEWGSYATLGGHFTGGALDTRFRIENP
jgi:hypothetical protein